MIILVASPAIKSAFFGTQQLPADVASESDQREEETITADNTETEKEGTIVFESQPQQPQLPTDNSHVEEDVQPPSEESPSDVTVGSEDNESLAADATSGVPEEEEISEEDEETGFFMATKRMPANLAKEIKSANIAIEVPEGALGDVSDKACAMIGELGGSVHLCFESVYTPVSYTHLDVYKRQVYHLGGASLDYNDPRKLFLNIRNNHLMLYKNLTSDIFKKISQDVYKRQVKDILITTRQCNQININTS